MEKRTFENDKWSLKFLLYILLLVIFETHFSRIFIWANSYNAIQINEFFTVYNSLGEIFLL